MTENNVEDVVVLVDFGDGQLREVADDDELSEADLAKLGRKSKDAVSEALATITWVAKQAKTVMGNLHDKPDEMELEFGIALTTKAGVIVLQGETQFHIKAKLVWKKTP
jgi:hypothetical protein